MLYQLLKVLSKGRKIARIFFPFPPHEVFQKSLNIPLII
ncbi:hypothetical protein COXBURSA331_A1587 [Coxiella burnetii RSA 331]|nr:hypothetical protein COXBURSA331_A1587 [Coxiella burnetii RSA 331]